MHQERMYLLQVHDDSKAEGERVNNVVSADKAKAAEAATPDHLKRPINAWAKLVEAFEDSPQYKDPALMKRIEQYRERAKAEEKRIDGIMAEKKAKWEQEQNPEMEAARAHFAGVEIPDEDRLDWEEAKGILDSGNAAKYYEVAAGLLERKRARIVGALDAKRGALDAAQKEHCDSHSELARLEATQQVTAHEAERLSNP
jgi:hypothetical protein